MTQFSTTSTLPIPCQATGAEHLVQLVPHEEGVLQAEAMENWFQACSTREPFALELVGTSKAQGFLLRATSKDQLILLSKQLAAQYPQAEIKRIASSADPLILRAGEHALIGEFALLKPSWMPLKTFSGKTLAETGSDPLAGILAAMEAVVPRERIISQLALQRAPETWISKDIRKAVEHPLQEERNRTVVASRETSTPNAGGLRILGGLLGGMVILSGYRWYQQQAWFPLTLLATGTVITLVLLLWWFFVRRKPPRIYDMKLVAEKLMRAAYYTHLRVIIIGPQTTTTEQRLRTLLTHLETAYHQFTLASANGLSLKRIRHLTPEQRQAKQLPGIPSAFPYHHPFVRFLHRGAPCNDVWNGLELAGAFHLPQETTDLPLVQRMSVKHLLFSPEIAHHISTAPTPLPPVLLGYSKHRGYATPVYLPFATLFSHKFLVGRSRSGKSVLMQLMLQGAMHPITDGLPQPGIFVIDPHHDLIEDLLGCIPPTRIADVILLDFTETAYPVGLNPLDATMGFTRDQAVSNLMSCFERVWQEFWGPRMAYFLKSVCLLLYSLNQRLVAAGKAHEQYTLLDINPLLQYQNYAIQVLRHLDMSETWHQELLAWWQNVYFALPKQSGFRQEVIMPIISKLGVFNDNEVLRRIIGQPVTTAPIQQAITHGKIVLCALSSRDLDDASINILGSTLINLLHRTFATQQHLSLLQRRKVFVAIDELQTFSGSMYDKLLSEDAKYGCAMLLSTQSLKRLNQIKDGLLEIILANCENLWSFNVSATDARLLEEEFQKKVTQKYLLSQPRLHCYTRLSLPGHPLQFASFEVAHPDGWQKNASQDATREHIRRQAQARCLPATQIDANHAKHLKQFLDMQTFAQKIQREAQGAQQSKQKKEQATELAQHIQSYHLSPASQSPQAETASPPSPSSLTTSTPLLSTAPKEQQHEHTSLTSPTIVPQEAGPHAASEPKRRRNHPRSRRNKQPTPVTKMPIGSPPPGLIQQETVPPPEGHEEQRPFFSSSGSWGRAGKERESRERA
ncbi:hypothetical protein EI42_04410 [Thermosporothrix hazakensis]|jgi:hypothetical protein|uniref:Uncharacterized protein n=1 Tax=Thermosporothrix hazakensis TaxID=644383 RepID=A0A326U221_THEHA|nr:hypothetical protein [Thermosporothrix hazakensis]PZW25358.1 hypothetical protein EI42_04410 [Thermosporothrix hazakensis]GCE50591.1 hypothetical protein KTH_54600 [Thermosporothrix hazakensis]